MGGVAERPPSVCVCFGLEEHYHYLCIYGPMILKFNLLLLWSTQRKRVCYFNTQKCAKPMSPVSARCTCAKLEGVLNEHMCYSRSVLN